jgi:hypothetical protein
MSSQLIECTLELIGYKGTTPIDFDQYNSQSNGIWVKSSKQPDFQGPQEIDAILDYAIQDTPFQNKDVVTIAPTEIRKLLEKKISSLYLTKRGLEESRDINLNPPYEALKSNLPFQHNPEFREMVIQEINHETIDDIFPKDISSNSLDKIAIAWKNNNGQKCLVLVYANNTLSTTY